MGSTNGMDKSNFRTIKAIAAMSIAGIIIAASLLLSGLSVSANYYSAFAQQNMTSGGGNATGTAGGNATSTAGGVNLSEVRMHLQEVRNALENNNVQGAMMHLDLALNLIDSGTQGNMTSTTTNSTNSIS